MSSMIDKGILIFLCGKMGAGKSFQSNKLARNLNAVLISEDAWLAAHYTGKISSIPDYLHYSALVRPFVRAHVQDILGTGTNVVMDFPANTAVQRAWFRDAALEVGAPHRLIYLKADDELCLSQIAKRRREQPERAAFDNEETFRKMTRHFEEPAASEGLEMEAIEQTGRRV